MCTRMWNRAYMYVQPGWRIFINHSVAENADPTLDSDASPPGSFSTSLLANGPGKLMPDEGRGKPLPPALGGWRPGFLPSVKAKVFSRPQNQGIVHYILSRNAPLRASPGGLGDTVYQDIIKTAFLLKMESQGDAGNKHITRPLLSDHVWWAWARSTLQSLSSISCRRPPQSAATSAPQCV
jgi:hypothetical protein